jgi:CIC family chloride channel protein
LAGGDLDGAGAGLSATVLTKLLELVQHLMWPGPDLLSAASRVPAWRHIAVLLGAGALTGAGQVILRHLTSGNGIDITEAISEHAGRLSARRTLGSAVLSILVVGMGASLGREGAPKQVGAVLADALSDKVRLSDECTRLAAYSSSPPATVDGFVPGQRCARRTVRGGSAC